MSKKKFLLVDDHNIVISGLKFILSNEFHGCTIVTANTSEMAVSLFKKDEYDLIILDINLAGEDSTNLMMNFINRDANVKILIFSMRDEELYASRYMRLGAFGFLNKDSNDQDLINAIRGILDGKKYLSNRLVFKITTDISKNINYNPFHSLSDRELEIALLIIKGQTVSQISKALFLHTSTIGSHKAKVFSKLGITNSVELINLAKLHNVTE